MISKVKKILQNNNLCVLSTCSKDVPDASLMLYICDESCTKMYMLTLKDSTKYLNIAGNKNVSILVDTRDSEKDETSQTKALTINGQAYIIEAGEITDKLIKQLINKHDRLVNLASNKDVRVVEVLIKDILFLEDVDTANHIKLY